MDSKQGKKQRAEAEMLGFSLLLALTALAWVVYELGIQGLEGIAAARSFTAWCAIAWTVGFIFPLRARYWTGFVIWVLLGVPVYYLAYLILGL